MKKRICAVVLGIILTSLAACTVAERGPVVQERSRPVYVSNIESQIESQQARIDQGIARGELTRSEANTLQDNLNWIRNRYARMRADGLLTPKEERRLQSMLAENSEMIYRNKHNIRRLY